MTTRTIDKENRKPEEECVFAFAFESSDPREGYILTPDDDDENAFKSLNKVLSEGFKDYTITDLKLDMDATDLHRKQAAMDMAANVNPAPTQLQ